MWHGLVMDINHRVLKEQRDELLEVVRELLNICENPQDMLRSLGAVYIKAGAVMKKHGFKVED